MPLTRTGLASVQDSGDFRVVTQPADGPRAGLGMLDVSLKISFRDQASPFQAKGESGLMILTVVRNLYKQTHGLLLW